ncbi:DUF4097 family beta strand repeat-containing protein [Microbispora rosea]|uniref:DUF4097 family beta strand repeat-containing protein n=1 Tax=Microbispora rosea TaxID=58117 RepID=UPI00343B070B
MPQWTIDSPGRLTFGAVTALNVRIVAGRLAVLASDGPPTLEVTEVDGAPLVVTHDDDGRLTVAYKDLTWDGILGWLRPGPRRTTLTLTVPRTCPVQAGVVSASAVVAGMEATTGVKSVSGEIVLDGVSGEMQAETVSGSVESRGLAGDLSFSSVSGDLTVAAGRPRRLRANTVSGRVTADLELEPTGHVTVNSMSGRDRRTAPARRGHRRVRPLDLRQDRVGLPRVARHLGPGGPFAQRPAGRRHGVPLGDHGVRRRHPAQRPARRQARRGESVSERTRRQPAGRRPLRAEGEETA